jgi:tetratricopeptide (TPR) repeat protein
MVGRIALLAAIVFALSRLQAGASQANQENVSLSAKSPSYSVAEYNEFIAASQNKSPDQRLAALDRFVAMHPHSALLPFAYEAYYSTYNELKKYAKTIEYADKYLATQRGGNPAGKLRALAARTTAFELSSTAAEANDEGDIQSARDSALRAIDLLAKIPKPEKLPAEQFEQEKKRTRAFYEYAIGYADLNLKNYSSAAEHLQFASNVNPNDALILFQLGIADLRMNPPLYLDGFWSLARSVAMKGTNAAQVRSYLKDQLLRYQQCACENLIDREVDALVARAATEPTRPTNLDIPSAEDLQQVRASAGPILEELRANDEHAQKVWLADCGLEFPEVAVKIISVSKEGDVVVLKSFRGPTIEEMTKATEPNMEIRVSGQPGVERLKTGDWVRFHGTLTAFQPDPLLLTWDKAQVNSADIPRETLRRTTKRRSRKSSG